MLYMRLEMLCCIWSEMLCSYQKFHAYNRKCYAYDLECYTCDLICYAHDPECYKHYQECHRWDQEFVFCIIFFKFKCKIDWTKNFCNKKDWAQIFFLIKQIFLNLGLNFFDPIIFSGKIILDSTFFHPKFYPKFVD